MKNFKPIETRNGFTILENKNEGAIERFRVVRHYDEKDGTWSSGYGFESLIAATAWFRRVTGFAEIWGLN